MASKPSGYGFIIYSVYKWQIENIKMKIQDEIISAHTHMCIYTHVCVWEYIYTHIYIHTYTVYVCMCIYIYTHIQYVYIDIYTQVCIYKVSLGNSNSNNCSLQPRKVQYHLWTLDTWNLEEDRQQQLKTIPVPLLSAKRRKVRLQFIHTHQNWTIEDWKDIWSDKSWFQARIGYKWKESMDPDWCCLWWCKDVGDIFRTNAAPLITLQPLWV